MSVASKAEREKLPDWQFGDEARRLFIVEEQKDIDLLLSRLTRRNYSKEYRGRVLVRCIAAAQRLGLTMPKWATPQVLAEAQSVAAFVASGDVPDIAPSPAESVTFAGGDAVADLAALKAEAEAQARAFAESRNRGRVTTERAVEVPGYDDVDHERLDSFIARRNERIRKQREEG